MPHGPVMRLARGTLRLQPILEALFQIVQNGGQVGGNGLGADAHAVGGLFQQGAHGAAGAAHLTLQAGQLGAQLTARSLRVGGGFACQTLQHVQLAAQSLQGVHLVAQRAAWLQLAHNAAGLLAGKHAAKIDAALHVAGLAAHDAADVVPHVPVAHGGPVDAGPQHAAVGSRNAAYIGGVGDGFGSGEGVHGDVRHAHLVLLHRGVHAGVVLAISHYAVIFSHDTADEMTAVHNAPHVAVLHDAGNLVAARDAAHPIRAADHTGKADVLQQSCVDTGHTAHGGAAALRHDGAGDGQIVHFTTFLHIPEQPLHRAVLFQMEPGNGVVLALKHPAESGNARKLCAGYIHIRVQHHSSLLAPAVQTAVFRQLEQILRRGNVNSFLVRLLGQSAQGQAGQRHAYRQQDRADFRQFRFQAQRLLSQWPRPRWSRAG